MNYNFCKKTLEEKYELLRIIFLHYSKFKKELIDIMKLGSELYQKENKTCSIKKICHFDDHSYYKDKLYEAEYVTINCRYFNEENMKTTKFNIANFLKNSFLETEEAINYALKNNLFKDEKIEDQWEYVNIGEEYKIKMGTLDELNYIESPNNCWISVLEPSCTGTSNNPLYVSREKGPSINQWAKGCLLDQETIQNLFKDEMLCSFLNKKEDIWQITFLISVEELINLIQRLDFIQ